MVSFDQLVLNFFSTLFILVFVFNLFKSSRKVSIKDFLLCLNGKHIVNISIFYYLFKWIVSECFSLGNWTLLEYFPNSSISKISLEILFLIFGNSFIIQGLKNAIIECFVIVLFCRRQFSLQSSLTFSSFMLFRAFHEPWVEKFRTIKRNSEDYSFVGRFFLLFIIGILVHFEMLFSNILLSLHKFRTVNIIVGFELIFLSSSMRGFLIDQLFLLVNELFFKGTWLSEDTCALYLRLVVFFIGGISFKHALDCLNISNKGIFKYYLLRRSFQCGKNYIESLEESTRYRKTTVSVGSLLRNPTVQEIDKLDVQACVICRGEMVPEFSKILSCGHIFHIRCLQNWVRRQYCCPICLVPISSDSLYSVKKKADFLKPNFEKKEVNIIAAATGFTGKTKLYSKKASFSDQINSLPTLNPDITSILFKNLFSGISFGRVHAEVNKIDFYLRFLEKIEKTRKSILKSFYLITREKNPAFSYDGEKPSGWTPGKSSFIDSRIQHTLVNLLK